MTRVLVVDDEPQILRALRINLRVRDYEVHVASTGAEALEVAGRYPPDLVILDLGLPDLDGVEVILGLRGWTKAPIIVLSGRADSVDKVEALDAGADDYVTKPFGVLELVARVEAVLRRATVAVAPKVPAADASRFGDIEIQPVARVVRKNGRPVELSPKEYELLLALVQRPGQVISRAELLKTVWGYHASVVSRTIDTHIAELRRKLEPNPASPRHITTVWKTGYRFLP